MFNDENEFKSDLIKREDLEEEGLSIELNINQFQSILEATPQKKSFDIIHEAVSSNNISTFSLFKFNKKDINE